MTRNEEIKIESAEITFQDKELCVIGWSGNIGFGQLQFKYNGEGGFDIDAEFISVETIFKIINKLAKVSPEDYCSRGIHQTNFDGKCFICKEQIFVKEKGYNKKEIITKLKEIEKLVELNINKTLTEDDATEIYGITNDLMCNIKKK